MPLKKTSSYSPRIIIMSIGGRGATILDRLHHLASATVELVAVGLPRSLEYATKVEKKIVLPFVAGMDAGAGVADNAKETIATVENEIRQTVSGADMVFLIGNLATESNAHQVAAVATCIRSMRTLTCFVGATAFPFQGIVAERQVIAGEKVVSAAVDGFLLVDSGKVMAMGSASEGLAQVNRVIEQMIAMILDIVSTHGIINVDFADLKTTIRSAGPLFFQSIEEDEHSIEQMKDTLFLHPALTFPAVSELTRVVYVLYAGAGVLMDTVTEIGNYIASRVDASARIVFGVVSDEKMKNKVKIVLIGA